MQHLVEYGPYTDINGDKWIKCDKCLITLIVCRNISLLENTCVVSLVVNSNFLVCTLSIIFISFLYFLGCIYFFGLKMPKGQGNNRKDKLRKGEARTTMMMTSKDKVEVVVDVAVVRKVGAEEQKTSTHLYKERLVLPINSAG